jgi:hypothetical protein
MITIEHANKELVIEVKESLVDGLAVQQGDDLIYVKRDNIKLFVAAVRAVATDMLKEEV